MTPLDLTHLTEDIKKTKTGQFIGKECMLWV